MQKIYPPMGCKIHKSVVISIRQTCVGGGRYMLFFTHKVGWLWLVSGLAVKVSWVSKTKLGWVWLSLEVSGWFLALR